MTFKTLTTVALFSLLLASTGCIGTLKAPDAFLNQPAPGMDEIEMIQTYGMPDYTHTSGDSTVHVYQVNEYYYYIAFGESKEVDMVVLCKDGKVTEVKNVKAGEGMAILQPNTWNVNR